MKLIEFSLILFGVLLNGVVPAQAFEIVLNVAALGIIASWGTIVICQIQLYRWSKKGILERPSFRLWGTPWTGYLTLAFLVGVLVLILLFLWLTRRIMQIGRQAIALDRVFSGLVAQGVGVWMGFQAFINMGVNLGALPTKGLTLPLMSFGGSAILMNLVAIAVVLRVDYENKLLMRGGRV